MTHPLSVQPSDDPAESPLSLLDDLLGVPLHPQYIEQAELDLALCERLYFGLRDFHQRNRIQPIDRRQFRPNLSFVGLGRGVLVNTKFDGYFPGSYIPRNGELTVPTGDIKSALLFTDAVVIEDPVFAFCRAVMCHRFQEAQPSWRTLAQALGDLAKMRALLEMRLVRLVAYFPKPVLAVSSQVPRTDHGIRVVDVLAVTDYNDPAVLALVAGPGPATRTISIRDLMKQHPDDFEWLYRQAESIVHAQVDRDAYAPFLPAANQYDVFAKLCRINDKPSPHKSLWKLSELNSGCVPEPEKVTFDDLARVRLDEEVFKTWRDMANDATTAATQDGSIDATDFRRRMDDHQYRWEGELRRYKGHWLKDVLVLGKQVSLGALGGLVKAATSGTPSVDSIADVLLGPVKGTHDELLRREAETAMAGCFAAIKPIAPRSPNEW
jgi:hypothetical protein